MPAAEELAQLEASYQGSSGAAGRAADSVGQPQPAPSASRSRLGTRPRPAILVSLTRELCRYNGFWAEIINTGRSISIEQLGTGSVLVGSARSRLGAGERSPLQR
jgi:hypothetical protein